MIKTTRVHAASGSTFSVHLTSATRVRVLSSTACFSLSMWAPKNIPGFHCYHSRSDKNTKQQHPLGTKKNIFSSLDEFHVLSVQVRAPVEQVGLDDFCSRIF